MNHRPRSRAFLLGLSLAVIQPAAGAEDICSPPPRPVPAQQTAGAATELYWDRHRDTIDPDAPAGDDPASLLAAPKPADFPPLPADLQFLRGDEFPWGRQLVLQQFVQGIPVQGGQVSVVFDRQNRPLRAHGRYYPAVAPTSTTPTISREQAHTALLDWLRTSHPGLPEGLNWTRNELVVRHAGDKAVLAYRIVQVIRPVDGAGGSYEGFVDAATGQLLETPRDINLYGGPRARIFNGGNPMAALRNAALQDQDSIPDAAYRIVTLDDLSRPDQLIGPHVDVVSLTQSEFQAKPIGGDYLFARNALDPAEGAKLDAVMAYYHIDRAQRYLQSLDPQTALKRQIKVNVNGDAGKHPYYSPAEDFIMLSSGGVDAGEDAEAILHEYFHAIQEWAKAGVWQGRSEAGVCAGTRAMAEGFSDYFASAQIPQKAPYRYEHAEWAATTSDLPKRSLQTGSMYPVDATADDYHNGEIWSSTLWQIRADAKNGRAVDALLVDALALMEPGFSFTDGAHAILAAGRQRAYSSNLERAVLKRFADRGVLGSDLVVAASGPAGPVKAAKDYTAALKVSNRGPENAAGVVVSGTVAGAGKLIAAPGCSTSGNRFRCSLGAIQASSEAGITLTLRGIRKGKSTVTAAASLERYVDDWNVRQRNLDVLDAHPDNDTVRLGTDVVEWCEDVSGTWTVSQSFRLLCSIAGQTIVDQRFDGSGQATVEQNGCRVGWQAGPFRRSGIVRRDKVSVGGQFISLSVPGVGIEFYNNALQIKGIFAGDHIDIRQIQAVVNGRGCAYGQCRDFQCSTPGGIDLSMTR